MTVDVQSGQIIISEQLFNKNNIVRAVTVQIHV